MDEKVFTVKAEINVKLTQQDIDDIMVAALEGGIDYWCFKVEVVGDYLGEYASEQISRGGMLKLYDIENGEVDCCNIDAGCADEIVQYALFGELVFG